MRYILNASNRLVMRVGFGVNWLHDHLGTEAGFNFTTSWRRYFEPAMSAGFDLEVGEVGKASRTHYLFSIGHQIRRCSLFPGYGYTTFGQVDGIHILVAGVEVLFWEEAGRNPWYGSTSDSP